MIANIEERIKLEEDKQKLMDQELAKMDEGIEKAQLKAKIAASDNISLELLKELNSFFDDAIQMQEDKMIKATEDAKDSVISIYEEQHEKKLELANEEYNDFMDKNDDRIKALRKRNEEEDYKKELQDMRQDQSKNQDRINEYKLIGTEASRKKILELREEYGTLEEDIEEKKLDKTRDLEIENLEEVAEASTDNHDNKINQIDEAHEKVVSAIEEEFDLADLSIKDLQELTKKYGLEGNKAIDGLITNVQRLKKAFIDAKNEKEMLTGLESQYNDSPEIREKQGYRAMTPEHMQTMIDNKLSYENAEASGIATEDINGSWGIQNSQIRKKYGIVEDNKDADKLAEFFKDRFGESWNEYAAGGIST
jgi:hypothetical protein